MNEDKVIQTLLKHEERLDRIEKNMANKDDVDKILQGQDKMIQLFTRIDRPGKIVYR